LVCVKTLAEAAAQLRMVMTFETKDGKIGRLVVRRMLVEMMYLDRLPWLPADTAGTAAVEENASRDRSRNSRSQFRHRNLHGLTPDALIVNDTERSCWAEYPRNR
jgi:hypothetical protein